MGGYYFFIKIDRIPHEARDQQKAVQLVEYTVREGDHVRAGQPVAVVETWWALLHVKAAVSGWIHKLFFEPGTYIREDDPIGTIGKDADQLPEPDEPFPGPLLEIIRFKRERRQPK